MGSVKPTPGFDSKHDGDVLRKAMKGMGTDEKAVIDVIGVRTSAELKQIALDYKTQFGRDLIDDLKSETSGNFREVILGRLQSPDEFDAHCLRDAIAGAGTDEKVLVEILATRTNAEIKAIKEKYKSLFKKDLEQDIISDTSGDFKRFLVSLVQGNRDETSAPNPAAAATDAQALYKAGEGKLGTDEAKFNQILATRSFAQLKLINEEYKKLSKKDLIGAIKSEFSGWVEEGLIAVVKSAIDRGEYFAERLYKSMKGAGTDDKTLIRVVVSRCEIDMVDIKQDFQRLYGKSLSKFIEEDTSGDYNAGRW